VTLFWLLSAVLIGSAVWTIAASKPVYSVVALLLNFAALAFMYMTLSAEFLAVIQIIVYSGAILVLFVFVIALLSSGVAPFSAGPNRLPKVVVPALAFVLVAFGFLIHAVQSTARAAVGHGVTLGPSRGSSPLGPVGTANVFGSVADFGKALFTVWLLPFEVTALILMVAVIGVVFLASDQTPYVPTRRHAAEVERDLREAILRGGD
jgi:NADH-quinone oxidoreductase subunit J